MYGIIGALDEEVELLCTALEGRHDIRQGPYCLCLGKLSGQDAVICKSGVGKVAAAGCAAVMCARYPLQALINTGAAGGIAAGMQVGDLALSTAAVQHDFDISVFGYKKGQLAEHPEVELRASALLLEKARAAAIKAGFKPPFEGVILSGDQFISSDEKVEDLRKTFPGSVAVEMEGGAIAQIAYDFKVPFLIVRAISDCADNHGAVSYDTFSREVSGKSASFVKELIAML